MNSNEIQTSNQNVGFLPVSEEDRALFSFETTDSSFTNPLSQDIVFTEEYTVFNDAGNIVSNGLDFGNTDILKDITGKLFEPQDEDGNLNAILFTDDSTFVNKFSNYDEKNDVVLKVKGDNGNLNGIPPQDDLDFIGGFGDYDGGNDITFEVKNGETVIETFSMTGDGYAMLYRDDESEYIFFSGTDENTKVDIDAVSNIRFEDFNGEALSIETTGSIEAENITLVEDDDPDTDSGLTLRAGIDTENSLSPVFDGYTLTDFDTHREMVDINYTGQIVGNDTYTGTETFFFYDGQQINYLPGYESSRAFGINDYNQMIGEGVSSTSDDPHLPFVVFGDGTVEEFTYGEGGAARYSPNSSGADVVYTYDPLSHPRDINNFLEIASYQLNSLPENAPSELQPRSFEDANFLSPNGAGAVNIGYELLNSDDSRAFGINNPGDVVGINRETDRAFIFNRENNSIESLGTLPGGDYSAAYAINDEGQVVGASTSGSGSRAFIYEDGVMKDMGVSYVGNPGKRVGIDINNLGQAIVTSAEGEPFVYQNGVLIGN